MSHTSTGQIVYDPYRHNMKRKTQWWCIVEVDTEITRYYREWVKREKFNLHDIERAPGQTPIQQFIPPAWDAHISVIRGEKPRHDLMHLWKKYDGMEVEFTYLHNPRQSKRDDYWTVTVECEFLTNIRKELERPYDWPLHLSVGKDNKFT